MAVNRHHRTFRIDTMTETSRPRRVAVAKARKRSTSRRGFSILGFIGELFLTAGVLIFLFLGWQLWLNDLVVGASQNQGGVALAHQLGGDVKPAPAKPDVVAPVYGIPAVAIAPSDTTAFGVIYIPRFGSDFSRSVSQGVESNVLNANGIGHYPGSEMPGEVGNFAVAAHRTTHGAPFGPIATLEVGDKIYVQTKDGYYTYVFRGLEYVRPAGVSVLDAVPDLPSLTATDRVMTMTSCNPKLSASERIIAFAGFESWQPTSAGPPAAIAATISAKG